MQGWVKLYRQILQSDDLFTSPHTFQIFVCLLLMADRKGQIVTNRKKLSIITRVNESSVYRAIQRLKKQGRISMKVNNKRTVISICKWDDYQTKVNNKRTTQQVPTRIKNKEYIYNNTHKTTVLSEEEKQEGLKILNSFKKSYGGVNAY